MPTQHTAEFLNGLCGIIFKTITKCITTVPVKLDSVSFSLVNLIHLLSGLQIYGKLHSQFSRPFSLSQDYCRLNLGILLWISHVPHHPISSHPYSFPPPFIVSTFISFHFFSSLGSSLSFVFSVSLTPYLGVLHPCRRNVAFPGESLHHHHVNCSLWIYSKQVWQSQL